MHVARVSIQNFRGISSATVRFTGTSILLGDNNSGKSTIFEALELALGPERLYRRPPINEHDFYGGRYLDEDGDPVPITIEVTIAGLDDELESRFRSNIEYWDEASGEVLETPPANSTGDEDMCLRVEFRGIYDAAEDEFQGQTSFCVPLNDDGEHADVFRTSDKREIGFLHLRALRTGTRAMSMERGSLLDVVLRSFEVELQMWEKLLSQLRDIPVAGADDDQFGVVIQTLDAAMKRIVSAEWAEAPHLRVSELTREDLRHVLRAFMATGVAGHAAPFNHQGSGTVNSLVIAMLSLIAERRDKRVIFAMEEPEISIPPTTQKRVVDLIRGLAGQAIFTSHSPYVIEEFDPSEMVVINRTRTDGVLSGRTVDLGSFKAKTFHEGIRTRFGEALLARRVLVVEGKSEAAAYPYLAKLASKANPSVFKRLDTTGWAVFDAGGDTNVEGFASLFKGLGKEVATIFDMQDPLVTAAISKCSDLAIEQPHKGFEALLIAEIPTTGLVRFADALIGAGDWPSHIPSPAGQKDVVYSESLKKLLVSAKGDTFALQLIAQLKESEYPVTMVDALTAIQALGRVLAPETVVEESTNPDDKA